MVAVSPPASRAQPSKVVAQVKMGPPRGAIKARARPKKKRLLSVEEDVPKKKKPLFPPRFQLLTDPDMLAHPLMAQELDSLLPILQTSLSALFKLASFSFTYGLLSDPRHVPELYRPSTKGLYAARRRRQV